MKILKADLEDFGVIMMMYESASRFMADKKQTVWPKFPEEMVKKDIADGMLWKLKIDDEIACIWSVTYSDPLIWPESEEEPSVYLHRITTSPKFRGRNLLGHLMNWVKSFALENEKKFIRLDTVGQNHSLIKLYKNAGFTFLGMKKLSSIEGLPTHYGIGDVCYFQLAVNPSKQ